MNRRTLVVACGAFSCLFAIGLGSMAVIAAQRNKSALGSTKLARPASPDAIARFTEWTQSSRDFEWHVSPSRFAAGEALVKQAAIASSLQNATAFRGFLPDHRIAHFFWLVDSAKEHDLTFLGWNASIAEIAEDGTVTLKVSPYCLSRGCSVTIPDAILERYRAVDGGWEPVDAREIPGLSHPGTIITD